MNMQTLIFNTTRKEVTIKEGERITYAFINVPTVKPLDGYYEVYTKIDYKDESTTTVPVFRAPIAMTNMVILK
jgi:hypothetical protein